MTAPKQEEKAMRINLNFCKKLLNVIGKGLVGSLGDPQPGEMCVEAAVAYVANEDHNDHPVCVDESIAVDMIELNDDPGWQSERERARGLRRAALAQLGTNQTKFNVVVYRERMRDACEAFYIRETLKALPKAERTVEMVDELKSGFQHRYAYANCPVDFANIAEDLTDWPRQKCLRAGAEAFVKVMEEMKTDGSKYLCLTERQAKAA
jgi:hypothetical protein